MNAHAVIVAARALALVLGAAVPSLACSADVLDTKVAAGAQVAAPTRSPAVAASGRQRADDAALQTARLSVKRQTDLCDQSFQPFDAAVKRGDAETAGGLATAAAQACTKASRSIGRIGGGGGDLAQRRAMVELTSICARGYGSRAETLRTVGRRASAFDLGLYGGLIASSEADVKACARTINGPPVAGFVEDAGYVK